MLTLDIVLHKSFDVWKTDTKFLFLGFCLAVRRKRRKKHIGILATWKKKERTPPFTKERERERGREDKKGRDGEDLGSWKSLKRKPFFHGPTI